VAWIGKDSPTDRAWRGAVLLGVALIAGAFALALVYPMVVGPAPAGTRMDAWRW
jgi:hypothetical protein